MEEEVRKQKRAVEKAEEAEEAGQIVVPQHRKIEEKEPQRSFEKESLPQGADVGLGVNDGQVKAPSDGKYLLGQKMRGLEETKWLPAFEPSEQPFPEPYAFEVLPW